VAFQLICFLLSTEIAALAMYNAGAGRVTASGAPKSTLDYISRILENKNKIENKFFELKSWYQGQLIELEPLGEIAEEKVERQFLMPLKPLHQILFLLSFICLKNHATCYIRWLYAIIINILTGGRTKWIIY
jgi:hypothetical protein